MAKRIVVAAVQTGIHLRESARAMDEAEDLVRRAADAGSDLVCLPEHWLGSKAVEEGGSFYARFSGVAKELGIYLNLGGVYERRIEGTYLTSTTMSPSGGRAGSQDKVHLYRGEKAHAKPGGSFRVFTASGIKVGVLVCHDIVFPESARTLALMGAELLIVPSLIVAKGTAPWHVYLKARALENRVAVVSPNCYWPPQFLGESNVIDLKYDRREKVMELREVVAEAGKGFLVAEVDPDGIEDLRKERLEERRTRAYEL